MTSNIGTIRWLPGSWIKTFDSILDHSVVMDPVVPIPDRSAAMDPVVPNCGDLKTIMDSLGCTKHLNSNVMFLKVCCPKFFNVIQQQLQSKLKDI